MVNHINPIPSSLLSLQGDSKMVNSLIPNKGEIPNLGQVMNMEPPFRSSISAKQSENQESGKFDSAKGTGGGSQGI